MPDSLLDPWPRPVTVFVMRVVGLTGVQIDGSPDPSGLYVASYDPDGNGGLGDVALAGDIINAKIYANPTQASRDYLKVSAIRPTRADGQPNRPLTAYAVEVFPVKPIRSADDEIIGWERISRTTERLSKGWVEK